MASDDVSVDLVKVDQVNGSTGSTSVWGPHVSGTESLTSGCRVSGLGKRKRKKCKGGVNGLKEIGPARRPIISAWLRLVRGSVDWAWLETSAQRPTQTTGLSLARFKGRHGMRSGSG